MLKSLTRLRAVSLNLANEGLATQDSVLRMSFQLTPPAALNMITSLTLTRLSRIDTALLSLITLHFPILVYLHISCTEGLDSSCCWTCLCDSATCIVHSPIPDMFVDVRGLAVSSCVGIAVFSGVLKHSDQTAYGRALKPLTKLKHLHLGVYLTSEAYFNAHLVHGPDVVAFPWAAHHDVLCELDSADLEACLGTTAPPPLHLQPVGTLENPPHLPANCILCLLMAGYASQLELAASVLLAQELSALTTIGWSSFFNSGRDEMESLTGHRSTQMLVERGEGEKLKVRRLA